MIIMMSKPDQTQDTGDTGENSVSNKFAICYTCFYFRQLIINNCSYRMLHLQTLYLLEGREKILKQNLKMIEENDSTICLNKPKYFHILCHLNHQKE